MCVCSRGAISVGSVTAGNASLLRLQLIQHITEHYDRRGEFI